MLCALTSGRAHTHTHTLTHSSVQRPARHPTEDFTLYPTVLPDRERPVCWAGARRRPRVSGVAARHTLCFLLKRQHDAIFL